MWTPRGGGGPRSVRIGWIGGRARRARRPGRGDPRRDPAGGLPAPLADAGPRRRGLAARRGRLRGRRAGRRRDHRRRPLGLRHLGQPADPLAGAGPDRVLPGAPPRSPGDLPPRLGRGQPRGGARRRAGLRPAGPAGRARVVGRAPHGPRPALVAPGLRGGGEPDPPLGPRAARAAARALAPALGPPPLGGAPCPPPPGAPHPQLLHRDRLAQRPTRFHRILARPRARDPLRTAPEEWE